MTVFRSAYSSSLLGHDLGDIWALPAHLPSGGRLLRADPHRHAPMAIPLFGLATRMRFLDDLPQPVARPAATHRHTFFRAATTSALLLAILWFPSPSIKSSITRAT